MHCFINNLIRHLTGPLTCFFSLHLVPFPQLNGDVGVSQIPTAAVAAQAQAAAVAAAQQHRQPSYDMTPATSMQPQNSSAQAPSMTSPPLPGSMSPHLQMPGQAPTTPQTQTSQTSPAPLSRQQAPNQMSPSGQMMTPPRSQGKTPPRDSSGKNLTQAQSPASQGDQSNSSGYVSATESKPNLQSQLHNVKTEPASPSPPQSQQGQAKVCLPCYIILAIRSQKNSTVALYFRCIPYFKVIQRADL